MTIHVCLLIYITILGAIIFQHKPYSRRKNILFIVFAFFGVFLVQSLRGYNVGWDTYDYVVAYTRMAYGADTSGWEFLFRYLMRALASISSNPQLILSICSFIILFGVGYFLLENMEEDSSMFWPVFLFVVLTQYFSTMNLLRQSVAMSIGCNTYTVLKKGVNTKNFIIAIMLVVISSLFHKTGIMTVLLILPAIIPINRKTIAAEFFGGISVYFLFPIIINVFVFLLPQYGSYIGSRYDVADSSMFHYVLGFIEVVMGLIIVASLSPSDPGNKEIYQLLFMALISFAFIVARLRIALATRLGFYFELSVLLLIPAVIKKVRDLATSIVIKMALYTSGWLYYIYSMTAHTAKGCVPYTFFWQ